MAPWSTHRKTAGIGAVALATALLISSCGGESDTTTAAPAPAPSAESSLAKLVPENIAADGKILIGSDASYPPNESVDPASQKIVGWEVELGEALAAKLGLQADFQNAGFDTIIPGIQSGKYELGISSFTDNVEREKVVDFVTYYSAGTSWAALKGNPKGVSPDDACGKKIGVQQGTVQIDDIKARNDKCVQDGKPAIEQVVRKGQTEVNADLVSGKIDGMLADSPIVGYAVKQTGDKLETIGQLYDSAPYGFAIGKNSGTFKDAVLAATKELIADGTYMKILEKWGVQDGAITDPVINGAGS
ncbi:ABC transporter substrate-binding protein [Sphaerimonospora mesophila]|uniref:ABC transporter substrate-binding protein n=1 Tax=Sphaerimonospora mesophila TaxID=37483 RepID=UPI0006E45F3E